MYTGFVFGRDVFLKTEYPVTVETHDRWSPHEEAALYHDQPLSFMCDFWDGRPFAEALLRLYPRKRRLLDLGTATGSVPLTMRHAGMLALGLDGIDAGKKGEIKPEMLPHDLARSRFAWHVVPEIVDCCDITQRFRIVDAQDKPILFDYIVSTDCFEHLIEARVPTLIDNIYQHLTKDGYGIFEISVGAFHGMHTCVKPREWWVALFEKRFAVLDNLAARDFTYVRSRMVGGEIRYTSNDTIDGFKILLWVKKR